MTVCTPRVRSLSASWRLWASLSTLMPVSSSASVSLGVRIETRLSSLSGKGRAGAGLRMTRTPALAARSAAACTVSSGVSSCITSTLAPAKAFFAFFTSAGESRPLAPEATAMLFSPSWHEDQGDADGLDWSRKM